MRGMLRTARTSCGMLLMLICVLLAFALAGCSSLIAVPMPDVKVSNQSPSIPVYAGSWKWLGVESHSSARPDQVVNDVQPTLVEAGASLVITYAQAPKQGSLRVRLWSDGVPKELPLDSNKLTLPSVPGVYVYEIGASWWQGYAIYVFKVEVK